jgi:hypothetical protein
MGGKLNAGARVAILFGYALKSDGAINGWRCYNIKTNRVTEKYDVTFNVEVPAMQHILATLVKTPLHYLLGARLTKSFNGTEYRGTVIDCDTDQLTKRVIYGVRYDDGEQEDLFVEELLRHVDEEQPLDSARVSSLHRNVRPDGGQRWAFIPPDQDTPARNHTNNDAMIQTAPVSTAIPAANYHTTATAAPSTAKSALTPPASAGSDGTPLPANHHQNLGVVPGDEHKRHRRNDCSYRARDFTNEK